MIATTKLLPFSEPYAFIRLNNHKAALVDEDLYEVLNKYSWTAQKARDRWYAVHKDAVFGKSCKAYMHRVVMNTPPQLVCHHVNGFSLDNRKANLQNLTRGDHDHTRWYFGVVNK